MSSRVIRNAPVLMGVLLVAATAVVVMEVLISAELGPVPLNSSGI